MSEYRYIKKVSNDTLLNSSNDTYLIDASNNDINIILPNITTNGITFILKRIDTSLNIVQIIPNNNTQLINNLTSLELSINNSIYISSFNSEWQIIDNLQTSGPIATFSWNPETNSPKEQQSLTYESNNNMKIITKNISGYFTIGDRFLEQGEPPQIMKFSIGKNNNKYWVVAGEDSGVTGTISLRYNTGGPNSSFYNGNNGFGWEEGFPGVGLGVAWSGERFVSVGWINDVTPRTQTIKYSDDGINWITVNDGFTTGNDITIGSQCVAYGKGVWVVGGGTPSNPGSNPYNIRISFDNALTFFEVTTPPYVSIGNIDINRVTSIIFDGHLFFATCRGDDGVNNYSYIFYSLDGDTWEQITSANGSVTNVNDLNSIAYNGSLYLAVGGRSGDATTVIWSKTGLSTWSSTGITNAFLPNEINATSIAWSGTVWVMGGVRTLGTPPILLKWSSDGYFWNDIDTTPNVNLTGINSVFWNGSMFLATNNSNTATDSGFVKGTKNGLSWTTNLVSPQTKSTFNQFTKNSYSSTYPVEGEISLNVANVVHIAGTDSGDYSMRYTQQPNINTSSSMLIISGNAFPSRFNTICYNGNYWISGSPFNTSSSIQYSFDGKFFLTDNITGSFDVSCNDIAWNGNYFIAVGESTNLGENIKISYDGFSWSNVTFGTFSTLGYGVCWDNFNNIWIAVGSDNTETIRYSTDGLNWLQPLTGASTTVLRRVKSNPINGEIIAVGDYNGVYYSVNGAINWNSNPNIFDNDCSDISSNGKLWIVVAPSTTSESRTIFYANQGSGPWNPINSGGFELVNASPSARPIAIEWTGQTWLATSLISNFSQSVRGARVSTDGINWTNREYGPFSNFNVTSTSSWIPSKISSTQDYLGRVIVYASTVGTSLETIEVGDEIVCSGPPAFFETMQNGNISLY